jgi:sugar lactone lactonase YvrE
MAEKAGGTGEASSDAVRMLRKLGAVVALSYLAACSSSGGTSTMHALQANAPSHVRSNSLSFTVFTAGQTSGFLSTAAAVDLAPDSSGNMWFTDGGTPAIGRIAPDGTVTEYTSGLPSGARPYSIVAGPDGNMWFSDYRGVAIGKITPSGTITEYDASQYTNSKAMGITFAGGEPWIVGFGSQPLLAHLTSSGAFVAQLLPVAMTPNGALTAGVHGNLWFLAQNSRTRGALIERQAHSGALDRRALHMLAAFEPCCPNTAPKSIAIGSDGAPWFTTLDFARTKSPANFLGTLRNGKVKLFAIHPKGLTEAAYPSGLAATSSGVFITGGDPFKYDGALWFVDSTGKQTPFNLPYNPLGLAVDANGNPWFTAAFSGEPSRIVEVTGAPGARH